MHAINPDANYLIAKRVNTLLDFLRLLKTQIMTCDNQQNSVEKSDIAPPASKVVFHVKLISWR